MATTLFERRIAVIGFFIAVTLIGCGRGSGNPPAPNNPTPAPTQSANWKLRLNQEELGTTADTGPFSKFLSEVMKRRHEQRVVRPGTAKIETRVYVNAEPTVDVNQVIKVIEVAKEAGASPAMLPMVADLSEAGNFKPDPLMLVIRIGQPESKGITVNGIELIVGPAIDRSQSDTIPKQFVAVNVRKDGEYYLDQTLVPQASLSNELKSQLKTRDDKRVCFVFDVGAGIPYRSLDEVGSAGAAAGASEVYIISLK